jgi:hypothetical protein
MVVSDFGYGKNSRRYGDYRAPLPVWIIVIFSGVECVYIRSRKQGDTDGTSNIVLPCPGS